MKKSFEVTFGPVYGGYRNAETILWATGHFLLIPAGAFYTCRKRGSSTHRRLAVITKPFLMQETPVTQGQYQAIAGTNPAVWKGDLDNPVEMVNWNDAVAFAETLSQKKGLKFRLPTEMEWEYAARGGDGDKYTYAGSNNIDEVAWYRDNSGYRDNSDGRVHPVKQKKPNGYGLYDMTGNVWEWCSDKFAPYPNQELIDYRGAESSDYRISRGNSWYDTVDYMPLTIRNGNYPDHSMHNLGFRLVLEAPKE